MKYHNLNILKHNDADLINSQNKIPMLGSTKQMETVKFSNMCQLSLNCKNECHLCIKFGSISKGSAKGTDINAARENTLKQYNTIPTNKHTKTQLGFPRMAPEKVTV